MLEKILIKKSRHSQIWVETAIYTLIGLTIIAILLSVAVPQVDKIKDKGIILQTENALNELNRKILETTETPGNVRIIYLKLAKGRLEINSENNSIDYVLENTRLKLSEVGEKINEGDLILETKKSGDRYKIFISMDYNNKINLTSKLNKKNVILQPGSTPYMLNIVNKGYLGDNKPNIDIILG